jgi:hypothetical protein
VTLPTRNETFQAELFEEVLFGPQRLAARPREPGTFRVGRIPAEVTTYRCTYAPPWTLPDGRLLELEVVSPLVYRARGEVPSESSRRLPPEFFVALKGREALQASVDGTPLVRYGSCNYESLPLWEVELRLEERYEEAAQLADTAAASLVAADLTLGAQERRVTDYFELVYSAARHNTLVDYWIYLDPPVVLDGTAVHIVELQTPDPAQRRPAGRAAYLDGSFEAIGRLGVSDFSRQRKAVRFRRGDANADRTINLVDVLAVLDHLFQHGRSLSCVKAGDTNDDGRLNLVDAITLVAQLFGRRHELPEPFAECGTDPSADALRCESTPSC